MCMLLKSRDLAGEGGGEEQAAVAALEGSRGWVLEQLAGAANLQSVSPATQQSVAHFLATLAFFELDASQVRSFYHFSSLQM